VLTRAVAPKPPTEVMDGERADVSWITTEEIDREGEVVIARGMNDSHFKLNPLVTFQHSYCTPPVGKCLWRKKANDGQLRGVKARTQCPKRPDGWQDDEWRPETILQLIQAGMLQGKSVGFVRLKSHAPSSHEIAANPEMAQVSRIIDEWLLIEYACTFLPMNQSALVEAVSKSAVKPAILSVLGIESPRAAAGLRQHPLFRSHPRANSGMVSSAASPPSTSTSRRLHSRPSQTESTVQRDGFSPF
jgi:hypothetical protein